MYLGDVGGVLADLLVLLEVRLEADHFRFLLLEHHHDDLKKRSRASVLTSNI
jgi:hypothetical protein